MQLRKQFTAIMRHVKGATAIEYGLILALVCLVAIAGFSALGDADSGVWGKVESKVTNAMQ